MSVSSYDAVAEKVLSDLEAAIKKQPSINEFYIIPTSEEENKNCSPICRGGNTLGLESWIISHIYPYAHHQMLQKNNYKIQNLNKLIPCLTGVALLNPEMATVWNKRKELIISKKMVPDNELRLTRMALSRKPKCNDVLTHRRWLITEVLKGEEDEWNLLAEELELAEMIANHYHSNYHAWSHRMWALQHLLPDPLSSDLRRKKGTMSFFASLDKEPSDVIVQCMSKVELINLSNCKVFEIYLEEVENNFKWISSHVSDHSGLHFRTFLLSEILLFIQRFLGASDKMKFQSGCCYQNAQNSVVPLIFTNGKKNLVEFLSSYCFTDNLQKAIDEYLMKLEDEITLLDVAFFLIVTELKSNHSLCLVFPNHEALWCYRKFLVHSFKTVMNTMDFYKVSLGGKIFVHQDKYGVPCKKDFKYDDDHVNEHDATCNHSNWYLAFYMRILSSEEEFISKAASSPAPVNNLIKNYSHWLKECLRDQIRS